MAPLRATPSALLLTAALALGCSGSDSDDNGFPQIPAGDDSSGPSGASGASGDESESSSPDTLGYETTTEDPPDTTDGDTSTSTTGEGETDGDGDGGLGDPNPGEYRGRCVGFDATGFVNTVGSRNGGNVGGSCSATPSTCGGDLVGAWDIENNCGNENTPNSWEVYCPGTERNLRSADTVGTVRFSDDESFAQTTTTTIDESISIDSMGCFSLTCADFEAGLAGGGMTATCRDRSGLCDCNLNYAVEVTATGTYAFDGDEVVLRVGDNVTKVPYCVSGDRLDMWVEQFQPTLTDRLCYYDAHCAETLGDAHESYWCRPFDTQTPTLGPFIVGPPWTP
jgi:hypothetical protein